MPVGLQQAHKYKNYMFLLLQATVATFDIKKKNKSGAFFSSFWNPRDSKPSIMFWDNSNNFVFLSKYN